jgi:TRAP-type uncharacterized transport system substrate-binding protein
MISGRAALVVIAMSVPWLVSCQRSRADMDPERAPATPVPLHQGATLYYRERELRR